MCWHNHKLVALLSLVNMAGAYLKKGAYEKFDVECIILHDSKMLFLRRWARVRILVLENVDDLSLLQRCSIGDSDRNVSIFYQQLPFFNQPLPSLCGL